MKHTIAVVAIAALSVAFGCSKESSTLGTPQSGTSNGQVRFNGHTVSRAAGLDGQGYSQSIPVDSANLMIQSYLASQNYPNVDNSLRSLSFNADTLRSYLLNSKITTIKFIVAHQPGYINAGNFGKDAGMNPFALTFVIAGLDESNNYILNSNGSVYEHLSPCPSYCGAMMPGNSQPISLDLANQLIQSYLTSQSYPSVDNSLRSLSFDADTLRSYLQNSNIKTLKLALAHQPGYINNGGFGKNAGMNPKALTVVLMGINQYNDVVLNTSGGFYEHLSPCPSYCGNIDAYIH